METTTQSPASLKESRILIILSAEQSCDGGTRRSRKVSAFLDAVFIADDGHGDFAGASHFDDAKGLEEHKKTVDPVFFADDFDGEALGMDIDDASTKDVAILDDFAAFLGAVDGDLDEDEFAVNIFTFAKINNVDDFDEFFEEPPDLLEGGVFPAHDQGHAADVRVAGGPDIERIDIITAATEHAGNPGEDAELVFDQHTEGVAQLFGARGFGRLRLGRSAAGWGGGRRGGSR